MTDRQAHWEEVWSDREPDRVSWYEAEPTVSLELIEALGLEASARVIDVGAGASRLVDRLLEAGFEDVTVLDVARGALEVARQRLGSAAEAVDWIVADVLETDLASSFDLWHDRALFHFLTDPGDRSRYVERLRTALAPGGHAIVATFSPEGPEECSGLPVRRYGAEELADELGQAFALVDEARVDHTTPWETTQSFQYAVIEKRA